MTLNTEVQVLTEADPHEVFHECRRSLGATAVHPFKDRTAREWDDRDDGKWSIGNDLGIGLPALMWVDYRPGVPLRTSEQAAAHDKWCDEDCDGAWHDKACWLEVHFDTAYGYTDEQGRNCGALHASYVAQLGQWLDERGIGWSWTDEYSGETHGGPDRYERLCDLFGASDDAVAWFEDFVMPAIRRETERGE